MAEQSEDVTTVKTVTVSDSSAQPCPTGRLEPLPFGCHEPGCLQIFSSIDLWTEHIKEHYFNEENIEESCSKTALERNKAVNTLPKTTLATLLAAPKSASETRLVTGIGKILAPPKSTSVSILKPQHRAKNARSVTLMEKTQLKVAPTSSVCNPKSVSSPTKPTYPPTSDFGRPDHTYGVVEPRPKSFVCNKKGCDQVFKTKIARRRHFTNYHAHEQEDPVESCSVKTMTQSDNNTKLIVVEPLGDDNILCTVCQAEFKSNEDLDAHMVSEHTTNFLITCTVCQTQFSSNGDLTSHTCMSSQHNHDNHELMEVHEEPGIDLKVTDEPAASTSSSSTDERKVTLPSNTELKGKAKTEKADDPHREKRICGKLKNSIRIPRGPEPKKNFDTKLRCASCCKEFKYRFNSKKLSRGKYAKEMKIGVHIKCSGCGQITYSKYEKVDIRLDDTYSNLSEPTLACNDPACVSSMVNPRVNTFPTSTRLLEHIRTHHNDYDEPRTCHLCGAQYRNRRKLAKHVHYSHKRRGQPIVKRRRQCPDCGMMFSSNSTLCAHNARFHRPESSRPNKCKRCDLNFTNNQELGVHNEEFHKRTYWCDICETHLVDTGEAHKKAHMDTHNPDRPKIKCNVCGRIYSTERGYKEHIKSHTANFKCVQCCRPYPSQEDLDRHMKKHPAEVRCQFCSKLFQTHGGLRSHMQTHHPDQCEQKKTNVNRVKQVRPPAEIRCQICYKHYTTRAGLRYHIKTQHPEQCDQIKLNDDQVEQVDSVNQIVHMDMIDAPEEDPENDVEHSVLHAWY